MKLARKKLFLIIAILILFIGAYFIWQTLNKDELEEGFISGNGRIEATQIDIATKLAGRIDQVLVQEGDFVKAGQPLASMQIQTLDAQLKEAQARYQEALNALANAKAQITLRQSDKAATEAVVAQRESELDAAQKRLNRTNAIAKEGAISAQELDDNKAQTRSMKAAVTASKAQVASAQAAIDAARAQATGAESSVKAAQATIARIQADIDDSQLVAPKDGRIQYRIAQPSEVLGAGGKVLSMIDLSDVYMTFFLPEEAAGKVALGAQARIVLDAAPDYVIPATISFIASNAQFTPKTVETQAERQKLMFRVKAQISKELLQKHINQVKTGLPGVAWIKLDPNKQWPDQLQKKLLQ
ncbi:HlyD family secretion protein [Neisseria sp. Ec49-e6-T10]|uniref:HlyD family secretion protein n=1 Tax=Neisseria sp. Ec49-e6-T10 TaxID=3140744 RepID=UPI003EB6FDB5